MNLNFDNKIFEKKGVDKKQERKDSKTEWNLTMKMETK